MIRQKSREPSFWENINTFVSLAYPSVAASRTMLQRLLTCLNFPLDLKDLSDVENEKGNFYELSQQHKRLKTNGTSLKLSRRPPQSALE